MKLDHWGCGSKEKLKSRVDWEELTLNTEWEQEESDRCQHFCYFKKREQSCFGTSLMA